MKKERKEVSGRRGEEEEEEDKLERLRSEVQEQLPPETEAGMEKDAARRMGGVCSAPPPGSVLCSLRSQVTSSQPEQSKQPRTDEARAAEPPLHRRRRRKHRDVCHPAEMRVMI